MTKLLTFLRGERPRGGLAALGLTALSYGVAVPYLSWLGYATYLNGGIVAENR